ncbi:MAG: hypothetical protein JSS72_08790 [Armatimonadetes bacterium]|nr:hypothetical protein [Armatimonadota bacterium]
MREGGIADWLRRRWPWLLLLILPLIPLGKPLLTGQAAGPFDQLRATAPWNAPVPETPWDILQADAVLQFFGWRDMVFKAWGSGHMPYWNPYEFCGTPLLANSQSGGFYPPHILVGILHLPTAFAITLLAYLHLAIAGLGAYALSRRLGAPREGAALAGVTFALSPFFILWAGLASVISTLAWLPWCLYFLDHLLDPESPRKPRFCAVALGLCLTMMILAGHLQFVFYGFLALGIWGVVRAVQTPHAKRIALALLALVAGGLLAMPQLGPVLAYGSQSHRRNTPTGEGYQAYVASALKPYELSLLTTPMFNGNPRERLDPGSAQFSNYWVPAVKSGANLAESAITIGPLVAALLLLCPWRNRRVWPAAAIGLVALLLALGTPLNALFYFWIPGWSSTGSPARIEALFVLMAAVLAGVAMARLPDLASKKYLPLLPLLLPILSIALLRTVTGANESLTTLISRTGIQQAGPAFVFAALGAAALYFAVKGKAWIAPAVAAATAAVWSASLLLTGSPLAPVQGPPNGERVGIVNKEWRLDAVPHSLLAPNLAAQSGIHEIAGYDSLISKDTVSFLKSVGEGFDPAPALNGNMMFLKPRFNVPKLQQSGVKTVWSLQEIEGLGKPTRDPRGFFVYNIGGPGRAVLESGKTSKEVTDITDGSDFIRLNVTGPGKLTVRDRLVKGWSTFIDGKPTEDTGDFWHEVQIPDGQHVVEFRYTPPGMQGFLALGLLGLILLFTTGFLAKA